MFKNSSKILFTLTLMTGTAVSVSSSSWLSAWMGLEINLLAFIPLMTAQSNTMSTEASLKYFLTQAIASSVLFMASIMEMYFNMMYSITYLYLNIPGIMILSSLLMKTGAAPFHFWLPSVMEGLTWTNNFVLMVWQKIAPLMLISYLITDYSVNLIIILSVLVGALGGLNQTSLRKLMAFSSINHLGWMITAMSYSESQWSTYFMIYSIINLNLVILFHQFNLIHLNQMFSMFLSSKPMKFALFINLLSLGGLPPFTGFIPKWMVIQSLVENNQMAMMIMMTIMSLITLYFYLRICFAAFLLNYQETNWTWSTMSSPSTSKMLLTLSYTTNFMLFSVTILYFFL